MLAQGSAMSCNRLLEDVTPSIETAWNINDLQPTLVTSCCNNNMPAFAHAPKPNLHKQISHRLMRYAGTGQCPPKFDFINA
jgi:hypothetical protein